MQLRIFNAVALETPFALLALTFAVEESFCLPVCPRALVSKGMWGREASVGWQHSASGQTQLPGASRTYACAAGRVIWLQPGQQSLLEGTQQNRAGSVLIYRLAFGITMMSAKLLLLLLMRLLMLLPSLPRACLLLQVATVNQRTLQALCASLRLTPQLPTSLARS